MGFLSLIQKWFDQPAPAAAAAPAPPSDTHNHRVPDDSIFRYPVRKVARGLRYATLFGLIDRQVTVQSLESADSDLLAVIGDYIDRDGSTPPLLHVGGGVHRKYGFLDVYLRGKSELLTKEAMSGIPLLLSLGLISREDGDVFMYPDDFEDMARDIAQMQTHLRLIMVDEGFPKLDLVALEAGQAFISGDYRPKFPVQFRIADACLSNSPHVWRWRHFYM